LKFILRQTAWTLLSLAFLYALLAGVSFIVFPDPSSGPRDFQAADRTLYMTVPKYVFLGRSVFDNPDNKVILVGASNTGVGFRQKVVQSALGCAKVSNLGMGGANISEVKQVIDLVHAVQDDRDRPLNTFVIGAWFGMFVDSDVKFADPDRTRGDTDIDIERYRYGFFRRTPDGPVAVLPPKWLDAGVVALRPLLLIEKVARQARSSASEFVVGRNTAQRSDAEREVVVMSEQDKKKALEYWNDTMGHTGEISGAQVALLNDTIESLLRSGQKVVLADLPIPAWFRDNSPYQRSYEEAIKTLIQQFGSWPTFASMTMSDLDRDLDYSDEVHAKPHVAQIWSTRLATVLDTFLCKDRSERLATVPLPVLGTTTAPR
jgi:hypothetical protein